MSENLKTGSLRDPSLDMIRCFAFMLVVWVHFFLRSGIYKVPVNSVPMFIVCTLRSFTVSCVPLFMLLTGYLQRKKKPEISYFVRIIPVLTVYVLSALGNIAFSCFYQGERLGPLQVVMRILNFKGARYAWYVEMYIALFLFSPYLNIIWEGLKDRRSRKVLLGIMFFVSMAPAFLNIWRFSPLSWWAVPSSNKEYHKLIPAWWTNLYPVTYYLIGCYLAEYRVRMERWKCAAGVFLVTLFAGAFNFWRSRPETFISGLWSNYASPLTCLIAVLLFVFFLSGDYTGMSKGKRSFFKTWASITLGAYLLSNISDTVIYKALARMVAVPEKRLIWMLVTVPLSAAAACAMSLIVKAAADPLSSWLSRAALRLAGKKETVR